jgi:hypothetical protein
MLSLLEIALAAFALSVISLNWYVFVRGTILRRPSPSWIPLLGGAAGCLALFAGGWDTQKWDWIPSDALDRRGPTSKASPAQPRREPRPPTPSHSPCEAYQDYAAVENVSLNGASSPAGMPC